MARRETIVLKNVLSSEECRELIKASKREQIAGIRFGAATIHQLLPVLMIQSRRRRLCLETRIRWKFVKEMRKFMESAEKVHLG